MNTAQDCPKEEAHRAEPQPANQPAATPGTLATRAIRGGAILMAGRFLVQGFTWAVTFGVARLLTPFDYGMMTGGQIFLGLADILADCGLGRALVQKKELQSTDIRRAFTLSLIMSLVLYGVLCLLAGPLALWNGLPEFAPFLRVLGLLLLLTPFRTVAVGLLDRKMLLARQATVNVLASVIQSVLVLALAFAGYGYWALTIAALVGRVTEVVLLLYSARWCPSLAWPRKGDGLFSFGIHISLASMLWYLYSNSDFLVVGQLFGAEILGAYALAFQLISLPVQKLTANVNQVTYPVYCRLADDRPRLRDWFLRLTGLLGFLGVPVLAGMALVASDACILLLKPKWAGAILPLQLLAGVGALMVYTNALPPLLNALGRPDLNTRYAFACVLIMPAGFVVGGWFQGIFGVCIAWILLYPVIVGVFISSTRHLTGVGLLDLIRAQRLILTAVAFMICCVSALRFALPGDESAQAWLRLVLSIATGVVSYAGFLLLFGRNSVLADVRALVRQLRGS